MIKIALAGLNIAIENKYPYTEKLAKEYLAPDGVPDFSVCATEEQLMKEANNSPVNFGRDYIESVVLYRNIAEVIPRYDAIVFHGAVIAYEGKAYAVTARSGVGKTTHLRLWLSQFGDKAHILNGDKPILRLVDGKVYACATPWRGKEGYGVPENLPLCGIGFLSRSEINSASSIAPSDAMMKFMTQIYIPKEPAAASLALSLSNKILADVPLYDLKVNMEKEAAVVARDAFLTSVNVERI